MSIPKKCPSCKSTKINKAPKQKWHIGGKTYRQLWKCKDCGKDKREIVKLASKKTL